jgi:hypothetical protein
MIRLKSILTEISLGQPYQTQFVWRTEAWGKSTQFDAPNTTIELLAVKGDIESTGTNNAWNLGFSTKTAEGWTVNQRRYDPATKQYAAYSVPAAEYMRILSTVAEAAFDFIAQQAPVTVTFEAYDSNPEKQRQKNAIYMALLRSASTRLKTMGYWWAVSQAGEVMISRKSRADASGIDTRG